MQLTRLTTEPILKPRPDSTWDSHAVLNTAACHDGELFHLFYRGITHVPAPNRSCIGHAWSRDGIHFERAPEPVLRNNTAPNNTVGVEDPRITKLGDTWYMAYSGWNEKVCDILYATSKDLYHWEEKGVLMSHRLFGNNKNAGFFPEKIEGAYALIHRPMRHVWNDLFKAHPLDIWLSLTDDFKTFHGHRRLLRCRRSEIWWEHEKIGIGAPPIRTPKGWLMTYHAVDEKMVYRLGLALLDLEDPANVLRRTDEPILSPEIGWEVEGDVKNVVFTCGTVLRGNDLWVFYGGADTVIGVAKGDVTDWIS
jgi:predicted GH43/DUF377 family glycosyl hydrolase